DVRFGVLAGRGDVPLRLARGEQAAHVALDLDPDRRATLRGGGDRRVEEAPVRLERVDEVRPRPARERGLDFHRFAGGALPGGEFAVRKPDAVLQVGELDRLAAAV